MMGCDSALEVEEFVIVEDYIDDVPGCRHAWPQCSGTLAPTSWWRGGRRGIDEGDEDQCGWQ
jgi:hypothetical protein